MYTIYRLRKSETMSAERIEEIIGRHRGSSYSLAIRLQQQFGMSWREATSLAGYYDTPSYADTPKPELPPLPISPEEIRRRNEETVRKNALNQQKEEARQREKEELLNRHKERLKIIPADRIKELMALTKARERLLVIRDDLWDGIGVVDEEPTIIDDKHAGAHIGVLMLRAPYVNRLTGWDSVVRQRVIKDYEDFASVRIGIYLPHLDSEPSYPPERDEERIAVHILQSNLESSARLLQNGEVVHPYIPIDPWPTGVHTGLRRSERRDRFRTIGTENMFADTLNDLLVDVIKVQPFDVRSLISPLPPLPTIPWYKRIFG